MLSLVCDSGICQDLLGRQYRLSFFKIPIDTQHTPGVGWSSARGPVYVYLLCDLINLHDCSSRAFKFMLFKIPLSTQHTPGLVSIRLYFPPKAILQH